MNLLSSIYWEIPPLGNEVWEGKVLAAFIGWVICPLACCASDEIGPRMEIDVIYWLMGIHLLSLLTGSPGRKQSCSLMYCFYLLTFASQTSHIS